MTLKEALRSIFADLSKLYAETARVVPLLIPFVGLCASTGLLAMEIEARLFPAGFLGLPRGVGAAVIWLLESGLLVGLIYWVILPISFLRLIWVLKKTSTCAFAELTADTRFYNLAFRFKEVERAFRAVSAGNPLEMRRVEAYFQRWNLLLPMSWSPFALIFSEEAAMVLASAYAIYWMAIRIDPALAVYYQA